MHNFSSDNSNILGHILIGVCKLWKVHLVFDHQAIINMKLQIIKIKWVISTKEVITETTPDPVSPVIEKFWVTVTIERPRVNSTFIKTLRTTQWSESNWDLKPLDWILTGELRSWGTAIPQDTPRVRTEGRDRVSVLRSCSVDIREVRGAPGLSARVSRSRCRVCPGTTPPAASRGHAGSARGQGGGQERPRGSQTPTSCITRPR